jgi:hypothetical protein
MDSFFKNIEPAIGQLDADANLVNAWVGGGIAMLLSAVLWGLITYYTDFHNKFLAIGVGFLVGLGVRVLGKGETVIFGLSGAGLSLLGCVLGNFLYYTALIAREENAPFLDTLFHLLNTPSTVIELFINSFNIKDLILYGVAAYVGYKTALDIEDKQNKKTESKPNGI